MKLFLKTSMLIVLAILGGCSKKNNPSPSGGSSSVWTIQGISYTGTGTVYTDSQLISTDGNISSQPDIGIKFSTRPLSGGTYTIVNDIVTPVGPGQCFIQTSNSSGTPVLFSYNGGTVNVTVNNGKITAAYTNVAMAIQIGTNPDGSLAYSPSGTSSGKLIEQ